MDIKGGHHQSGKSVGIVSKDYEHMGRGYGASYKGLNSFCFIFFKSCKISL